MRKILTLASLLAIAVAPIHAQEVFRLQLPQSLAVKGNSSLPGETPNEIVETGRNHRIATRDCQNGAAGTEFRTYDEVTWSDGSQTVENESAWDTSDCLVTPPQLDIEPIGAVVGQDLSLQITPTGGRAPFAFSASNLHPDLSLDLETGLVSGRPSFPDNRQVTFTVVDAAGIRVSQTVTLEVASALSVSSSTPVPALRVDTPYTHTMTASGGTAPYSWHVSAGTLPDGLAIEGDLLIGTPRARDARSGITITVTDAAGRQAHSPVYSFVFPSDLSVTTTSLPAPTLAISYTQNVSATGGTAPYSWSVASGSLPSGLSIDASGRITGTTTSDSTRTFTLRVRDRYNWTATRQYTLKPQVQPMNIRTNSGLWGRTVTSGQSLNNSELLRVTGGVGPYSATLIAGSLPRGVSATINQSTGIMVLSGTANADGGWGFQFDTYCSFRVSYRITDSRGTSATVNNNHALRVTKRSGDICDRVSPP